jgi:glycosyltransferase involved in cell wall biosynthesis
MTTNKKILFISDKAVFSKEMKIAGLQVRILEFVKALSSYKMEIIIAVEEACDDNNYKENVTQINISDIKKLQPYDISIIQPFYFDKYKSNLKKSLIIIDGFESPFGSFLHYSSYQYKIHGRKAINTYEKEVSIYLRALKNADYILCANERQKISYSTILAMLGKLNPINYNNPNILLVHSFFEKGIVSDELLNEFIQKYKIKKDKPTIVWIGGLYPWFDIETFIKSLPIVIERINDLQILLIGLNGVENDANKERVFINNNSIVKDIINKHKDMFIYIPWLKYNERSIPYYLSTVAVTTYRNSLENNLSMRTRVADLLTHGVPVITTEGDYLSEVINKYNAGRTVKEGDYLKLSEELINIISDSKYREEIKSNTIKVSENVLNFEVQLKELVEIINKECD